MRRLRYWEQAGLIVPSIKRRLSDHNAFPDLRVEDVDEARRQLAAVG